MAKKTFFLMFGVKTFFFNLLKKIKAIKIEQQWQKKRVWMKSVHKRYWAKIKVITISAFNCQILLVESRENEKIGANVMGTFFFFANQQKPLHALDWINNIHLFCILALFNPMFVCVFMAEAPGCSIDTLQMRSWHYFLN